MSDTDSSTDEKVAEDYFKRVPESERFVNVDLLVGEPCLATDNGISGRNVSDTLQKGAGNDFQDVSREYGIKKNLNQVGNIVQNLVPLSSVDMLGHLLWMTLWL